MTRGQYTRVFPGRGWIQLDGGLNNKFDRAIIELNESPDCLNVVFTNGSVETRGGSTKLNTASVGSFVCDGLYTRHTNAGSQSMVAFFGGTMWSLNVTTFSTIASAQSVFTAGVRVAATEYENYLFVNNGGAEPYKYNSHFTRHGIPAPTQTATVASNAVGVLTGDYRYKVTYVNSALVESDVSPISATFTAAGATLRVSNIPVAPTSFGVNQRYIYRNSTAASGTYYRVGTIADNTTTQFDDNNADAALGSQAPTDQGVPPKYTTIVAHQNRLFMNDIANPNFIKYTELANPYVVKAANFIRVGDNASDLVVSLGVYSNAITILCQNSAWLLYMETTNPSDWRLVRCKSPYGTRSPYGIFQYNNKLGFPAVHADKLVGFATLVGDVLNNSTTFLSVSNVGSDKVSERIEPDVFDIQESYLGNISSIVFKNKAYITVTHGNGSTANNRYYVYDFSASTIKKVEGAWIPNTGVNVSQMTIYNGSLYGGSSTANGHVYRLEVDGIYADDGAAINSYIWTKEIGGAPGDENVFKDFRFVDIFHEKSGAYEMDFTYRVDSDRGVGNTLPINLDPGGSVWGTMDWGDTWGGGNDDESLQQFVGQSIRGKRIQIKFSNQNTVNQKFKIMGINVGYNIKGRR